VYDSEDGGIPTDLVVIFFLEFMVGTKKATTFPADLVAICDKICGELYNRSNSCLKFEIKVGIESVGIPPSFEYPNLNKAWFLGSAKKDNTS